MSTERIRAVRIALRDLMSPQAYTVLDHLATAGSISQREALLDNKVQSLTKRISEIRKALGPNVFRITTVRGKNPITGQRYARYVLEKMVYAEGPNPRVLWSTLVK